MSLSRMASIDYLIGHVAAGDGRGRSAGSPLTGTTRPRATPGHLARLRARRPRRGRRPAPRSPRSSCGRCSRTPATRSPVNRWAGRRRSTRPGRTDRPARRQAAGPMTAEARAALVEKITAEEKETKTRTAVAGFDLTFSVPKSVSALWALATAPMQEQLYLAHRAALAATLELIEARGGVHPHRATTASAGSAPPGWSRPRSTIGTPARATRSCTPTSPSPTGSRARTGGGAPWTRRPCTGPPWRTPRPTTCCWPTRSPAAPA